MDKPILANRDYPYHDYASWEDGEEPVGYAVGKNNRDLQGSQNKLFVSKSTLVFSDTACTVRWNDTDNVVIAINPNVWYTFECDIHLVYVVVIGTAGTLQMWFEGVLPDEARTPE